MIKYTYYFNLLVFYFHSHTFPSELPILYASYSDSNYVIKESKFIASRR
jgi:hypothetical protein